MPVKLSIEGLKKELKMYRVLYFNNFHNNKRDKKKNKQMLRQIQFQLVENHQLKKELDEARDLISEYISK